MIYTRISNGLALVATLFALGGAVVFSTPNLANAGNGQDGNSQGQNGGNNNNVRGAPGPIAGAGLPVLAVGYGVYWLIKRRRRKAE
jgi:hypothetical protein